MTAKKLSDLVQGATQAVGRAAGQAQDFVEGFQPDPAEKEPVGQPPAPVHRKVLLVNYSPRIKSEKGRKLWEVMNWNDPDKLVTGHIADLKEVSHGYANYQVVERIEVDKMPVKADGFAYDPDQFVKNLRAGSGFHQPDAVDYYPIVKEFDILNKVKSGAIDEIWLFAFPYAGFYEASMGGPEPFWCNAPQLERTEGGRAALRHHGLQLPARHRRDAGEPRPPGRVDSRPRLAAQAGRGQPVEALCPLR